jgi:hypothetical protein
MGSYSNNKKLRPWIEAAIKSGNRNKNHIVDYVIEGLNREKPYNRLHVDAAVSWYLNNVDFRNIVDSASAKLEDATSINEVFDEESTVEVNDTKWVVDGTNYLIKTNHGDMKLTIEMVDELFYEYSRYGLDMSQIEIRNKHNLEIWQWHAIKSTFWLYKDSNIFSPYTEQNTDKNKLPDMIRAKMNMKFDDKRKIILDEYTEAVTKDYNRVIKQANIKEFAYKNIVSELYDFLPTIKEVKVTRTLNTNDYVAEIVLVVADLHIGAHVKGMRMTPNFDSHIAEAMLDHLSRVVNEIGAGKVHLAFLGDNIESFSGLNHPNSWKSMGTGMYGSAVIKEALRILEGFIGKVNNVESISAIAGNHDRSTASNKEDDAGEMSDLMFHFIERIYRGKIPVQHDALIISKEIDGVNYMFTHGDKRILGKDPKNAIINYGNPKLFNMIVSGHLHSRHIPADGAKYRWYVAPSIFPGNWYSEQNGWHAIPGAMVFSKINSINPHVPMVMDIPIPVPQVGLPYSKQ